MSIGGVRAMNCTDKFKGKFNIMMKVLGKDKCIVGDIYGNQVTQRPYEGVIGPNQMKWLVKV